MEKKVKQTLEKTKWTELRAKHKELNKSIEEGNIERFCEIFNSKNLENKPETFFKLAFLNLSFQNFNNSKNAIRTLIPKKTKDNDRLLFYQALKQRVDFVKGVIDSDQEFNMKNKPSQTERVCNLQALINRLISNQEQILGKEQKKPRKPKIDLISLINKYDDLVGHISSNEFNSSKQRIFFHVVFNQLNYNEFNKSSDENKAAMLIDLYEQSTDKVNVLQEINERAQITLNASKAAGNIEFASKVGKVVVAAKKALESLNIRDAENANTLNVKMLGVVPVVYENDEEYNPDLSCQTQLHETTSDGLGLKK